MSFSSGQGLLSPLGQRGRYVSTSTPPSPGTPWFPSRSATPVSSTDESCSLSQLTGLSGQASGSSFTTPLIAGRSPVWRYFVKQEDKEKDTTVAICNVPKPELGGQICGERKGTHINTLKSHLRNSHPSIYNAVMAEETANKKRQERKVLDAIRPSDKKKKRWSIDMNTLFVPDSVKYNEYDKSQKLIDNTVAVFVGATNVPYSITSNVHFQRMIRALDFRYRIPGRTRLMSLIDDIVATMKSQIQLSMATARKINFCADIWSKKGLTSSYLGLTAHFYCPVTFKIKHATLAVRELPHPHTGDAICNLTYQIIEEWQIPSSKIQYIITDNGSNMVKAFKSDVAASKHQNIRDFTAEVELEVEHNEDEEEEEEEEELGDDRDKEVADFDSHEARHGSVFRQQGLQRLSCFSHTLQLVVSSFNKDSASKELLSTAYKVVQQVSQSGKVTEALISAAGKKLVSRSVTRWTSAYLVIDRLLEVKEPLKIVLLNHNLTMLQPQDWEVLKNVRTLLYKFANYTNVVGGEQYTTLSLVIPYYIELQHHLKDMMKIDKLQSVSKIMALELERRFSNLLDPAHENHNSLYMVATLLDPRFKNLLEKEHIAYARKECIKLLCNGDYESDSENAASSSQPVPSVLEASESDDEPANKRFRYVFDIMDKKATEKKEVAKRQPNLPELQLDSYIHTTARTRYDPDSDPILFWIQSKESYTFLAPFAIDILAAPSSSAPVERTFSTAGIATSGRRNRLAKDNLEKEVLLKKNEEYYMKIYSSDKTSV